MPAFGDPSAFPTFYTLPVTTDFVDETKSWYILAQIKNNMTITKPTLIVTDQSGMDFAVTFENTGFDLKARGLKKGNTVVIPQARRTDKGEGRKDVLVVESEDCESVKAIPGKLDWIMELGSMMDDETHDKKCGACGKAEGELMRCTGCGEVVYCGKVSIKSTPFGPWTYA
ncbi:uncharacterized protein JN550_002649 [Neoarthrinium moseri]|uniref:uncharacterized protein n=1 Tax=Neoarthrinium moseri TaxID=1658444 RepID=UPI001FDB4214|nr:uncharacterized protein JN550_002649 [Neoarthrinium moseri]KAI1874070.1 hypothetical protein JN550_002649 [Neoarthrinium moseri]